MKTKMIVAYDLNRCIGKRGKLPWHIPSDMEWFKKMTTGHPVIMGRKTWDSLKVRPLPNRFNCVISQQAGATSRITQNFIDVDVFSDIRRALFYCEHQQKMAEVWVIGGAEIYKSFLNCNLVDEVYVNEIQGVYDGDTYFPRLPVTETGTWEVTNLGIMPSIAGTHDTRMMKYTKVAISNPISL